MIQLVVIGMLLFGVVWFTYSGFTASSLVGGRWLPALAFASVVGAPVLLAFIFYGVAFSYAANESDSGFTFMIAGGVMEFSRYALLALMLYLIARRLPEGSRDAEGSEATEGGD